MCIFARFFFLEKKYRCLNIVNIFHPVSINIYACFSALDWKWTLKDGNWFIENCFHCNLWFLCVWWVDQEIDSLFLYKLKGQLISKCLFELDHVFLWILSNCAVLKKVKKISMTSNVLPLHFAPIQASSSQKFKCW